MIPLLVLISNACTHKFENLQSFSKLFKTLYVFDNGLSPENKCDIIKAFRHNVIFKHYKGINPNIIGYDKFRNTVIEFFKDYNNEYIFMIDDSYEIEFNTNLFNRTMNLVSEDILVCDFNYSQKRGTIARIFKKHCRYTGFINEYFEEDGKTVARLEKEVISIRDVYNDSEKSSKRLCLINSNLFRTEYHKGNYLEYGGEIQKAIKCYSNYSIEGDDVELRHLSFIRLFILTRLEYYLHQNIFKPRHFESLYYLSILGKCAKSELKEAYEYYLTKKNEVFYGVSVDMIDYIVDYIS